MAKQTFTTGQVLLASQLTSLQQTALGGGAASAKTASYTLVAADAGTTISMTSTSATTVTINSGLFAAGDTVFIQNLGTGACTVTAGSATVATAGSLILPQNDAGILYFVSASSSVFYDYIQAGAVSPLTTKGDVYTFSTSDARLAVGTNGQVLTANSAAATGLEFATPSSGGMTLISTTTFDNTVATYTVSSIAQTFKHLLLVGSGLQSANAGTDSLGIRLNGDSGSNYSYGASVVANGATSVTSRLGDDKLFATSTVGTMAQTADAALRFGNICFTLYDYTTTSYKAMNLIGGSFNGGNAWNYAGGGFWNNTAAITSINFASNSGGNLKAGIVRLYGVS